MTTVSDFLDSKLVLVIVIVIIIIIIAVVISRREFDRREDRDDFQRRVWMGTGATVIAVIVIYLFVVWYSKSGEVIPVVGVAVEGQERPEGLGVWATLKQNAPLVGTQAVERRQTAKAWEKYAIETLHLSKAQAAKYGAAKARELKNVGAEAKLAGAQAEAKVAVANAAKQQALRRPPAAGGGAAAPAHGAAPPH